ncbi:2-amino-4-hydroxy-6-hydroxymethyldihydropteridine diphosphokinase [Aquipuribacter hungaricus]|uniref:Bifunctional folate synthesis protein n=1 Tax=Aquipuribacter hungaricus TaxID=545624 RepID=A0ABV7WK07_9MICO
MSSYLGDYGGPVDQVAVRGIRGRGTHGVLAHEKRDGQEFSVDVVLHVPTLRAGSTDDLADAVDYSVVAQKAHAVLVGPSLDLVEAVAGRIAAEVMADPRLVAVDVTVHKPQAPVGVPFDDVTVTVRRTRDDVRADTPPEAPVRAVLALGANLGDPYATLHEAVLDLSVLDGVSVVEASPVVDSAPVGGPEQGRYLNAVVLVDTTLSPRALLHACQDVETAHGRAREVRWGPRTLDVDVVTYGDLRLDAHELGLPHPMAAGRRFVLLPWSMVDASAVLSEHGFTRPVAELLEDLLDDEEDVVVRTDLTLPFGLPPAT